MVTVSPEGIITDVNEATVTVLRVPRDQLIGTTFSDYFTDPKKAAEIYKLVFTEGSAVEYPLALCHRDETLTEVLYNAPVYRDASGKGLGVFAAARGVTKRTIAQREAAHQQAIELDRLAELETEAHKLQDPTASTKLIGTGSFPRFTVHARSASNRLPRR